MGCGVKCVGLDHVKLAIFELRRNENASRESHMAEKNICI